MGDPLPVELPPSGRGPMMPLPPPLPPPLVPPLLLPVPLPLPPAATLA